MNNNSALFRVTADRQQAIKWTSDTHVRPLRTMSYTCGYLCTELHCIAPGRQFLLTVLSIKKINNITIT